MVAYWASHEMIMGLLPWASQRLASKYSMWWGSACAAPLFHMDGLSQIALLSIQTYMGICLYEILNEKPSPERPSDSSITEKLESMDYQSQGRPG